MKTVMKEDVLTEHQNVKGGKEKVEKIMNSVMKKSEAKENSKKTKKDKDTNDDLKKDILSGEILIKGENSSALEELKDILDKELRPSGEIESIIVDRIVSSIWRMRRCLKMERQIMDYASSNIQEYEQGFFTTKKRTKEEIEQLRALKILDEKQKIEELTKYETVLERQIYLALRELNKHKQQNTKIEKKQPATKATTKTKKRTK